MRIYELTIILNPNLDKEQVTAELDKLTGMIESANGKVLEVQHLGLRRISFEMKGNLQGNYYTIYFKAAPELLPEMDKSMKLNESILRSLTIVLKPSEYSTPEEAKAKADLAPVETVDKTDDFQNDSFGDDNKDE
jgi:small subunit ribosomal protein S6